MRQSSLGRKSSTNRARMPSTDRDDKNFSSTRSEPRTSNLTRPVRQSGGENSQIPRIRFRSASSERASSIRKSTLKVPVAGKPSLGVVHHLLTTPIDSRTSSANKTYSESSTECKSRSSSAERASVLGNVAGPKKDTRPITDKNYQTAMLNRIDSFFHDANQLSLLNSTGSLKPISLKIFVNVSDFLLQLLDAKHDFTINNYMEELPKIAKKLNYPGTMTKSWLKTANTMHSWHHVLAWLSWLVEICEAKDIATEQLQLGSLPFTDAGDGEAINRDQFSEMLKLYQVWNDGKEEEEAQLIDKYIEGIANNCGFNEQNIYDAELEIEEATKKHDELIKREEEIKRISDELKEELQAMRDDEKKQLAHQHNQEQFIHNQQIEIQKLENDSIFLEKEKQKHLREHEELNSFIGQQSMTIEEQNSILNKCTEIESYMKQFEDHLDEIQKEAWTLDIKFAHVIENLRKAILAYNTDIVINITQDKNRFTMPESSLADPDIMLRLNEKAEAIMSLKESIMKQLKNCKTTIDVHSHELEILQEKKKMMDQEASEWILKMDEKRLCIKDMKLSAQKNETTWRDLIKKLEDELKQLQDTPDLQPLFTEIAEAKDKFEAVKRRKIFLERSAERFFTKFYEILYQNRKETFELIEKNFPK